MPVSTNLLSVIEDLEVVQDTIVEIQSDSTVQRADLALLSKKFDELEGKLRFPGTKFLVDLEYRLVYEGTLTAPFSSAISSTIIESLPGTLHAVYIISAYCAVPSVSVICDGSASDLVGIHAHLVRTFETSPARIDVTVRLRNTSITSRDVVVRVWRRLGIGS